MGDQVIMKNSQETLGMVNAKICQCRSLQIKTQKIWKEEVGTMICKMKMRLSLMKKMQVSSSWRDHKKKDKNRNINAVAKRVVMIQILGSGGKDILIVMLLQRKMMTSRKQNTNAEDEKELTETSI